MNYVFSILFLLGSYLATAQAIFAPAPGIQGSSAIHKDSSAIVNWATTCHLVRGYIDAADTNKVYDHQGTVSNKATNGVASYAIGNQFGPQYVVSFGDLGEAILEFEFPIKNGIGNDFVIFENGFRFSSAANGYFLELAFVEVSSNGVDFFRFPAVSNVQDSIQIREGQGIDPAEIHNFAGKYPYPFGTPFDLEEIVSSALDLDNIRFVKIIDVGGKLGQSFDSNQRKINDPYPTAYHTGGFDLMAVGVIHQNTSVAEKITSFYPNPVVAGALVTFTSNEKIDKIEIVDANGKILHQVVDSESVLIPKVQAGAIVFAKVYGNKSVWHSKILVQ